MEELEVVGVGPKKFWVNGSVGLLYDCGGGSIVLCGRLEAIDLDMSKGFVVGLMRSWWSIQVARVSSGGGFELQVRAGGVVDTQWW